jgi:DNA polymerase IIIc chi subunit
MKVEFHTGLDDKLDFACRLLRKSQSGSAPVVVAGEASRLDRLDVALWTFDALSFVSHARLRAGAAPGPVHARTPLWLADEPGRCPQRAVLVNLLRARDRAGGRERRRPGERARALARLRCPAGRRTGSPCPRSSRMTPLRQALPTLTEVIEVVPGDERADIAPLPLPPDSVPLELLEAGLPVGCVRSAPKAAQPPEAWVQAVLQRLQPRLDAWLETRATQLLGEASRTLARELAADLPGLARAAIDELAREPKV